MINDFLLHRLTKKITHWLLVAVILLYGITGYGITQYRIVEPATLGLLTKPLAFKIHDNLLIPLLVLLALHIYQIVRRKAASKQRS
jgi:dolichol kinase